MIKSGYFGRPLGKNEALLVFTIRSNRPGVNTRFVKGFTNRNEDHPTTRDSHSWLRTRTFLPDHQMRPPLDWTGSHAGAGLYERHQLEVDWGDGTTDKYDFNNNRIIHYYNSDREYKVKMRFTDLGRQEGIDLTYAFRTVNSSLVPTHLHAPGQNLYWSDLMDIHILRESDFRNVKIMNHFAYDNSSLLSVDLKDNVENVVIWQSAFMECKRLQRLALGRISPFARTRQNGNATLQQIHSFHGSRPVTAHMDVQFQF